MVGNKRQSEVEYIDKLLEHHKLSLTQRRISNEDIHDLLWILRENRLRIYDLEQRLRSHANAHEKNCNNMCPKCKRSVSECRCQQMFS